MLKFNGGNGALLCDNCRIIIEEPYDCRKPAKYTLCKECQIKDPIKQVICIRTDLNMRKGKMVSQGAHAAMKVFFDKMEKNYYYLRKNIDPYGPEEESRSMWKLSLTNEMEAWKEGIFTKIVVKCESEVKLLDTYDKAMNAKIICALIQDNGLTEFKGVPTYTCIAIGPDLSSKIDPITGEFPLL